MEQNKKRKIENENEYLLQKIDNRFTLFPIKHKDIWDFAKNLQSLYWEAESINPSEDLENWNNKLNDNERYFIRNILAFFAASDGIVNENLLLNFSSEIEIPEIRYFYSVQIMNESIHSETYSLLIDTFITDEIEKHKAFNAIEYIPAVQKKAKWALKWIGNNETKAPFVERLIAFVCVEGLFFSGSFCSIFWLKSRGLMTQGLAVSNEYIARDEGIHCDFAILLYNKYIQNKLSENTIHNIFKSAVEIETEFVTESLPVRLIGMNHNLMIQYIQFVADRLLLQLNYKTLYNVDNPFTFMENQGMEEKSNFFEKRVTSYSSSVVNITKQNINYNDDDF